MATVPKLIVLTEQFEGQKLFELTGESYPIGRTDNNAVCLPDNSVSSAHCELVKVREGSYKAVDLGSSNGTRINGVRITEQDLVHSDILQVGGIEIMYHCEDEAVTSSQSSNTGINLEDTAGGLQIQDMGNVNPLSKKGQKSDGKKANIVIYGFIGVMGLIVIILAIVLIMKMF